MKNIIATTNAPAAIGPYSQATEAGGLIFVSGQLPIDPATGAFPEGVEAQTRQSLTNAKAILAELERGKGYEVAPRREEDQISMSAIGEAEVLDALRRAQVETLTPIEAMQLLYELKQKLK